MRWMCMISKHVSKTDHTSSLQESGSRNIELRNIWSYHISIKPYGGFLIKGYPQIIHWLIGFSTMNHHFWGSSMYGNPHYIAIVYLSQYTCYGHWLSTLFIAIPTYPHCCWLYYYMMCVNIFIYIYTYIYSSPVYPHDY